MNPNDPCVCGSGERYGRCHRPLHRTPPSRFLEAARKFYVRRWVVNASRHSRLGHYGWMLDQIEGPVRRVVDIGPGDASGMVEILRRYSPELALGIEENPECARRARTRLKGSGRPVADVVRMRVREVGDGSADHRLEFEDVELPSSDVGIVVTDLLFDHGLGRQLRRVGPFDLVTVWLVGSHEARAHCLDLRELGHMTAARYRLHVQNAAYELADVILRPGGCLQIVDRLLAQDCEITVAELRTSHEEQASPTSLEISSIDLLPYRGDGKGGIQMLRRDEGQGTPTGAEADMVLASVVSVRR